MENIVIFLVSKHRFQIFVKFNLPSNIKSLLILGALVLKKLHRIHYFIISNFYTDSTFVDKIFNK